MRVPPVAAHCRTGRATRKSPVSKNCGPNAGRISAHRVHGSSANIAWPTRCMPRSCCASARMVRSSARPAVPIWLPHSPTCTCRAGSRRRRRSPGPSVTLKSATEEELETIMKSRLRPLAILSGLACIAGIHSAASAAGPGRTFTPTDLNSLARVSDPQVSPKGSYVVYVQRETDFEANRGRNDLWLIDLEAPVAKPRRLTQHSATDTNPRWAPDGASIYFLSSRAGSMQIWRLPMLGGEAVQITDYPLDIGSFRFSPDGERLAITMAVFKDCADLKCTRERLDAAGASKATARSYDALLARHWDAWRDHTRSNLFVAPVLADGRAGTPVNVSGALDADVPSKPMGGDEEFTFSPDGKHLVFSARVAGREEAWSTNFDLYEVPATGSAAPKNLTADNPAWDTQPVFLRNGDLAYLAMKRPG